MEITKGMIDAQNPPSIDQEKLKQLLTQCFQDVILTLYCNDIGTDAVTRVIDTINNRINDADLKFDTGGKPLV